MQDLGPLVGTDSTAFAVGFGVVGQAQTGGELHAFAVIRFRPQPTTDLGTLGGTWSAAYGASNRMIVGASRTAGNVRLRAFQYVDGPMTALPVDLGGDSAARAVNDGDDIVGYTCTAGNALCRPFLLSNGVMTLLGPANRGGVANAITAAQEIVGTLSVSGSAATHAFLYANSTMTDLGTLGGPSSEARAINEQGEIVGSAQNAAGQPRAFLWRNGQMIDLNTFVPSGSGWALESAAAISDGGQIAGYGTLNGKRRAFLLTPPADLRLVIGGTQGQTDSNVPRSIEVGKTVTFVNSAVGNFAIPGVTVRDARMIHTLTGPAEFVSAQAFDGNTCEVTPTVVTCQIVHLDTSGTGRQIHVRVRATGPGPFEHHATLTSGVPDPNPTNNSVSEANRAVSMSAFTVTPSTIPGGGLSVGQVVLTGSSASRRRRRPFDEQSSRHRAASGNLCHSGARGERPPLVPNRPRGRLVAHDCPDHGVIRARHHHADADGRPAHAQAALSEPDDAHRRVWHVGWEGCADRHRAGRRGSGPADE